MVRLVEQAQTQGAIAQHLTPTIARRVRPVVSCCWTYGCGCENKSAAQALIAFSITLGIVGDRVPVCAWARDTYRHDGFGRGAQLGI